MSLVFAALVPHPPMLLPSIGREHGSALTKTWEAYQAIGTRLREAQPDTIIVISPHLPVLPETFSVGMSDKYETHFHEFGDFSEPRHFKPDFQLIERLRRTARGAGTDIMLTNQEFLDYGCGVPLSFLPDERKSPMIVPIAPAAATPKKLFAFGQAMKDPILHTHSRIALICSAELSHRHASDSPSGFSPRAAEFDNLMTSNLSSGSASAIIQMDEKLVRDAHSCGYGAIVMLLGILDRMEYRSTLLSYEAPFGVGYATVDFRLSP